MDVYALLSAERSFDRPAAVVRVALSQRKPHLECSRYFVGLNTALREEFPPFATDCYADLYRAASASGQWLAMSLIANAEREGESAKCLWTLSVCADYEEEQRLLKRHACDESNHALAYLDLLDLCFPGAIAPSLRSELNQLSPHFSMRQEFFAVEGSRHVRKPSIDDYLEMNIAEIRATIYNVMQRTTLAAHCPVGNMRQVTRILELLARDGLRHVADTAALIERKAVGREPREFYALFCKCVRDFSRITSEEPIDYSYNQRFGNYP